MSKRGEKYADSDKDCKLYLDTTHFTMKALLGVLQTIQYIFK